MTGDLNHISGARVTNRVTSPHTEDEVSESNEYPGRDLNSYDSREPGDFESSIADDSTTTYETAPEVVTRTASHDGASNRSQSRPLGDQLGDQSPHPGRTITACDGRPPCGVCEACRVAAPTSAPDARAVAELLAWLDAVASPSGWLSMAGDVWADGKVVAVRPAHAAATVRGLVLAAGEAARLREANGYVLGAAVRYQLGRRTYGSGIVADAVVAAWPTLRAGDRANILRDVREAFAREDVGDACDAAEWRRILALDPDHARAAGGDAGAGVGTDA